MISKATSVSEMVQEGMERTEGQGGQHLGDSGQRGEGAGRVFQEGGGQTLWWVCGPDRMKTAVCSLYSSSRKREVLSGGAGVVEGKLEGCSRG